MDTTALDGVMLNEALDEQGTIEANGFHLQRREWLRRDAYVAEYQTNDGAVLGTQRIGKNSVIENAEIPRLVKGETIDDFARRASLQAPVPVADLATDRIWFTPTPLPEGEVQFALTPIEQVAQALAACNQRATTACNQPTGYFDAGLPPFDVFTWSSTFSQTPTKHGTGTANLGPVATPTAAARGSSAYTAICVRGAPATVVFSQTNPRFGFQSPTIAFTVQLSPLEFFAFSLGAGWNDHHCSFLDPSCVYRFDFNQSNVWFGTSAGDNLQTFCGKVTDHNSMYFSNDCNHSLGTDCPGFEDPFPDVTKRQVAN